MHWPNWQHESSRPVRKSPLHDRLAATGAHFGETAGWERPNWFAAPGAQPALVGKRYVNAADAVELLCTKGGKGELAVDGEPLSVKQAKALPSSD